MADEKDKESSGKRLPWPPAATPAAPAGAGSPPSGAPSAGSGVTAEGDAALRRCHRRRLGPAPGPSRSARPACAALLPPRSLRRPSGPSLGSSAGCGPGAGEARNGVRVHGRGDPPPGPRPGSRGRGWHSGRCPAVGPAGRSEGGCAASSWRVLSGRAAAALRPGCGFRGHHFASWMGTWEGGPEVTVVPSASSLPSVCPAARPAPPVWCFVLEHRNEARA